jgi:putative DNA primase/helicase
MDSTYFKQLVSGEPIEARLPHGAPFVLRDYAKFIFNTNNMPRDVEHNEAFFRRLGVIKFGETIPVDERDPKLAQKIILTDLPGIFNWVLDGLSRLLVNQGFTISAKIDSAVTEYRQQSDTVYLYMDEKGYEIGEDKKIDVYLLHHDYQEYCKNSGYRACARKTFNDRLRNLGYTIVRHSAGMVLRYTQKNV